MIFVTVGSERFPFDRLVAAVEQAVKQGDIREEVFAQIGACRFEPTLFKWKRFIDFDEQTELFRRADIVISHAGEGSVLLASYLGKMPIFFPRQASFGEHVDDHQVEFVRKLESRGRILAAYSEQELLERVKNYKTLLARREICKEDDSRRRLVQYLRNIIQTN